MPDLKEVMTEHKGRHTLSDVNFPEVTKAPTFDETLTPNSIFPGLQPDGTGVMVPKEVVAKALPPRQQAEKQAYGYESVKIALQEARRAPANSHRIEVRPHKMGRLKSAQEIKPREPFSFKQTINKVKAGVNATVATASHFLGERQLSAETTFFQHREQFVKRLAERYHLDKEIVFGDEQVVDRYKNDTELQRLGTWLLALTRDVQPEPVQLEMPFGSRERLVINPDSKPTDVLRSRLGELALREAEVKAALNEIPEIYGRARAEGELLLKVYENTWLEAARGNKEISWAVVQGKDVAEIMKLSLMNMVKRGVMRAAQVGTVGTLLAGSVGCSPSTPDIRPTQSTVTTSEVVNTEVSLVMPSEVLAMTQEVPNVGLTEPVYPTNPNAAPTATETTTPETPKICAISPEQLTQMLLEGKVNVAEVEAVPLISQDKTEEFLGGEQVVNEVKTAIQHMVEQLIANNITKIAIPEFAQDLVGTFADKTGVSFFVQTVVDGKIQALPEGYYTVEGKGFNGGGYGTYVWDTDGDLKAVLEKGTTKLSGWLMDPLGLVDFGDLPAQKMWGEPKIIKVDGCGWMVVQVKDGQVMAVLAPNADVKDLNSIWALKDGGTVVAEVARKLGYESGEGFSVVDHEYLGTQLLLSEEKGVAGVYYQDTGWVSTAGWTEKIAETYYSHDPDLPGSSFETVTCYVKELKAYVLAGVTDGTLIEEPFAIPTENGVATNVLAYSLYYLDKQDRLQVAAVPLIVKMPDGTTLLPALYADMEPGMEAARKTMDQVMAMIYDQLTIPGRVVDGIFFVGDEGVEQSYKNLEARGAQFPPDHPFMVGLALIKGNMATGDTLQRLEKMLETGESPGYVLSSFKSSRTFGDNPTVVDLKGVDLRILAKLKI